MRQLILFRHAKAEPSRLGLEDHDRALALQGWDDAPRVARATLARGGQPDLILCSTARRCRQTLEAVEDMYSGISVEFRGELYLAEPNRMLSLAVQAAAETGASKVMMIAHNPGTRELATRLSPMGSILASNMRRSFPTASMAVLQRMDSAQDDWDLASFITPADLRNLS
ncbi:MAG: phosphohistidine phosphatase [Hirschia sp.]|nr:phosphohistidine phosphatase [Hirschia sp.]MBF19135.1 phosphohistidine phosphatase [Hirschia sp.]|tara:strand:+ start:76 stop:585 length:510 start_codon:yes stop_codon:yes gene_type:complete